MHVLANGQATAAASPPGWVALLFFGTVAVAWLGALAYQLASWRRASGDRRQQLKWLLSGTVVCAVLGIWAVATNSAIWEVALVGVAALPVSIGVGILRYRLYDIDRIISRTLAYALVTGLLVGVYAGLVLLATEALRLSSSVSVAAATLAAAALFNPVRRRVQRAVDRRFNGPGMTRTGPSRRSASGSRMPLTCRRCRRTWLAWCVTRCIPPTCRSGFSTATGEAGDQ